jgi:hypothetical protein
VLLKRWGNSSRTGMSRRRRISETGKISLPALSEFSAAAFKRQDDFPSIYNSLQRRYEAIWRIPIGDNESDHGLYTRATDIGEKRFKRNTEIRELVKCRPELLNLDEHLITSSKETIPKSYLDRLQELQVGRLQYRADMRILTNKRFYLTYKGYIGFGPPEVQKGDVVCLIFGANSPFVLRKVHGDQYRLVGEVYCDGIMDGEFLKSNPQNRMFTLI